MCVIACPFINLGREKTVKKLRAILKDESGQGMLEYVMLLAVVASLVLIFKDTITTKIKGLTTAVGVSADKALDNN